MAKTTQEKLAALKAEITKLEAQDKAERDAKLALVGGIILDAMENDSDLKSRINALLSENVKRNADRILLGLPKIPSKRGRPAKQDSISTT